MKRIDYGNEYFEFEVVRKNKKNIGIIVTGEGLVRITAPFYVEDKYIDEVVYKKAKWIMLKLEYFKKLNNNLKQKSYSSGESLSYLGERYKILVKETSLKRCMIGFDGRNIEVSINMDIPQAERQDIIRDSLIKWYRERARDIFKDRTDVYSRKIKLYPGSIRIKEQKTMWGSCSGRGNINYNWKLVMAPMDIVDYVVVHELCHLRHRDHSSKFWDMVASIVPDYMEKRKWLRENGGKLLI